MATIPANPRSITEPTAMNKIALGLSDTFVFKPTVSQVLYLFSSTVGPKTVIIDGDGGTTIRPRGYGGDLDVSSGKSIEVNTNDIIAVDLQSISAFCQGEITVTGGSTLIAWIVEG